MSIAWEYVGTYQPGYSLVSTASFSLSDNLLRLTASSDYSRELFDYCYVRGLYLSTPVSFATKWIKYYPSLTPIVLPEIFSTKLVSLDKRLQFIQFPSRVTWISELTWNVSVEVLREV